MGKLTRQIAQQQAARIMASPMLAPSSDTGRTELVECLLRNCADAAHAERTMTTFLDNALQVQNVTAELASIAASLRTPEQAPPGCPVCEIGVDERTGEMLWAAHVPVDLPSGISCARRCSCERGRWLSDRGSERAMGAPPPKRHLTHVRDVAVVDRRLLAAGDRAELA